LRLLRQLWNESSLSLGEIIEVVFAGDVRMSGKNKPERKPGQLLIRQSGDGRRQNRLRRLLVVLVASCDRIGIRIIGLMVP
jgi:hypothetical protein